VYPIHLSKKSLDDIPLLKKENPKFLSKLWELVVDIHKNPYDGIGQPEPLKGTYKVGGPDVLIVSTECCIESKMRI